MTDEVVSNETHVVLPRALRRKEKDRLDPPRDLGRMTFRRSARKLMVHQKPRNARRINALVVFSAACVGVVGFVYVGAVHTSIGRRIDSAAVQHRAGGATVERGSQTVLDTVSISTVVLGAAILGLLAIVRHRPPIVAGVLVLVMGANLTTQLLKAILVTHASVRRLGTFPSGHATVAMSLALALLFVVPSRGLSCAGVLGVGYAVLVGAATVTRAWHRPSEVIAAYLVCTAWAAAIAALLLKHATQSRQPDESAPRSASRDRSPMTAWVLLVGVALALAAVATVAVILAAGTPHTVLRRGAYAGALIVITVTATVLSGTWIVLVRGTNAFAPDPYQ
jgi:hypothetical protein